MHRHWIATFKCARSLALPEEEMQACVELMEPGTQGQAIKTVRRHFPLAKNIKVEPDLDHVSFEMVTD